MANGTIAKNGVLYGTNLKITDSQPIGQIIESGTDTTPPGYLAIEKSTRVSVLRKEYPDLFKKIGTKYGYVDSTHFNLPCEDDLYGADSVNLETYDSTTGEYTTIYSDHKHKRYIYDTGTVTCTSGTVGTRGLQYSVKTITSPTNDKIKNRVSSIKYILNSSGSFAYPFICDENANTIFYVNFYRAIASSHNQRAIIEFSWDEYN